MQKFSLPLVMDGRRHQNERKRSRSKVPRPNVGIGVAMGHHGEVLQGGVDHGEGIKRFLVTLPWPSIKSRAKFFPLQNSDIVTEPEWKLKSRKAAMLTMLFLGIENHGGFSKSLRMQL